MPINKALTFRASSIGDCLMGKYLLENIHRQYPDARLGIVVASRGAMIRDLFAAYPWLEILEASRRRPSSLVSLWKRYHGSDLVVTQYAGKKGGKFALASKIAARVLCKRGGLVGFEDSFRFNNLVYHRLIPFRLDVSITGHERTALKSIGLPVSIPFPKLEIVRDDSIVSKYHLEKNAYVVVHLFAGNKSRGLSPDKKRALIESLVEQFPGLPLLVTGGPDDREEALRVAEGTSAIVCAGETNLQETMNLISESRGVVSVDTGIAHIAAQLGKPLVVLRSCLAPNWWFEEQYGKSSQIAVFSCDSVCAEGHIAQSSGYPKCLDSIDMEEVAQNAKKMLT
ncbi:MAG: glycosyltransferase family 9 protein [Minisyncoccia bacterium]